MAVWGVICEYNPFHRGHGAMLAAARDRGADTVVCAMSGNFVQRGDAAVADKFARAEMAVRGGADLVLELPTPWAMATAETFARGGVQMLAMAGCDTLAFGSESGEGPAIEKAAEVLLSPAFEDALRKELAGGATYAAARQTAAEALGARPGLLAQPNDILAVEYCKAIRRLRVDITPLTIPRIGPGHDGGAAGEIASASHIRELLRSGDLSALDYLPQAAADIVKRELDAGRMPVDITHTERAILDRLRRMDEADFARWDTSGEGLYHRVYKAVRSAAGWDELLEQCKTKRYPTARLRRMLLAAWLDLPPAPERPPCLRVLAATEAGRRHLRTLQKAAAPVLTKPADVAALGAAAEELFTAEARRTDLYELCRPKPGLPGEDWRYTPLML